MSDLYDLYQELILDHNRRPRNRRAMSDADHRAEGYNPLCGDRVTVSVKLQDGVIEDIVFDGTGCAISTASASLMTEALKGRTMAEADAMFRKFHALLTEDEAGEDAGPPLGKLKVFSGVSRFPVRVKCATLAWHTVQAALRKSNETVTTE